MFNRWTIVLLGLIYCILSEPVQAQDQAPEYKIKATYLYYFGLHTKWPKNKIKNKTEFIIGVIGENNPFGKHLNNLENQVIHKRKVIIRHYKRVEDIKDCDVLYVNSDMRNLMQKINKICEEHAILTFADYKGFATDGGCVTFFNNQNDQIRFWIQQDVVDKRKLIIDSKLLKLSEKE